MRWQEKSLQLLFFSVNVLIIRPVQHFSLWLFVALVLYLNRFHPIGQIVIHSICAGVAFSCEGAICIHLLSVGNTGRFFDWAKIVIVYFLLKTKQRQLADLLRLLLLSFDIVR